MAVAAGSTNNSHPREEVLQTLVDGFALAAMKEAPLDQYRHCAFLRFSTSSIPSRFVLAILAVENYGRPSFRRWEKAVIARSSVALFGKLPNFSLGVGQVKPSTARLVLGATGNGDRAKIYSDLALLRLLLNPCENIGIVVRYLTILKGEQRSSEFNRTVADQILRVYNGQLYPSFDGWLYRGVVWKIYETLSLE
jgi:hypothetical protein